jgi:hypothetical protein
MTVNQSNLYQVCIGSKKNALISSPNVGSPESSSDWATGMAREKVTRERARMVLMNIIVFVLDKNLKLVKNREVGR